MALVMAGSAVLTAACSGGGAAGGTAAAAPSGPPAIGADESLKVLRDWTDRHNRALTSGDEKLWRDTVTGPLAAPVTARVRTYGKLPDTATISLANPVLYVPRRATYPKWFGIAALERSDGKDQQVLGVFVKTSAKDGWRAAHWLTFQGGAPDLAYDAEGYAIPAPDRGLPAAHANYLAKGDATGMMPDPFAASSRKAEQGDWTVAPGRFAPGPGPSYALRTGDGGSLVWYGLTQDATLTGGTERGLPADVRDYLAKDGRKPGETVHASWQWLAIGYAPPSGKASVLGESVSLTTAR